MQCIETIPFNQPSPLDFSHPLQKSKEISNLQSFIREDPEEWIRSNIISRNMLLKGQLLGRLGMGSKIMSSMSKEGIQRMSRIHAREQKEREDEENSIAIIPSEELEIDRSYSNAEGDFLINFCKKTDDEMRQGYINRLINMKILKLQPAKKHQTMIIFDWDDTLLCTKYLSRFGFVDVPSEIIESLEPLDDSASKLLLKSVQHGQTFIITNSAKGWVQCSAKLFLPKTYQVILDKDIQVISARSGYADMFPGDSHRWKVEAFLDIERYFDKNIITNLLCLGDSHIEMDAAHILAQKFSQAIIKTIKLKVNPVPTELVKQQNLIREKMEQIYMSTRNLTIRLEKTRY